MTGIRKSTAPRVSSAASRKRDHAGGCRKRDDSEFLQPLVAPGASPMCGNSICQDRRFLYRHMPALESFFHYRNLDVSTLKELARRWAPGVAANFVKHGTHLAHADIHESIRELRPLPQRTSAPEFRGAEINASALESPAFARKSQVSTTVSGLSDMLSMPCSSNQRASRGDRKGPGRKCRCISPVPAGRDGHLQQAS